jgi:hypothetical protein
MTFFSDATKFDRRLWIVLFIGAVALSLAGINATFSDDLSAEVKQVQSDVRTYLNSSFDGDVDTYIGLTHPKEIEREGGPDAFRLQQSNMARMMRAVAMRLNRLTFKAAPQFLEGSNGRRFVIVPYVIINSGTHISGARRTHEGEDFKLGILEPGTTDWKYIGGHVGDKGVQRVFPDFPAGVQLPPRTTMRLS